MIALYQRIWMDWFWRLEKRWYAHASPAAQARARFIYRVLFGAALLATGRRLSTYVAHYQSNRGMNFDNDVHDWLGGWPYEAISPGEVDTLMQSMGFQAVRVFNARTKLFGRNFGLFGSGCVEYVYRSM